MATETRDRRTRSWLGRFHSQRTTLRVAACVAASRSLKYPDEDESSDGD